MGHDSHEPCSLVGGLVAIFYFPRNIGLLIIPIDFHIFQRGGSTTNQFFLQSSLLRIWLVLHDKCFFCAEILQQLTQFKSWDVEICPEKLMFHTVSMWKYDLNSDSCQAGPCVATRALQFEPQQVEVGATWACCLTAWKEAKSHWSIIICPSRMSIWGEIRPIYRLSLNTQKWFGQPIHTWELYGIYGNLPRFSWIFHNCKVVRLLGNWDLRPSSEVWFWSAGENIFPELVQNTPGAPYRDGIWDCPGFGPFHQMWLS